MAEQHRAGFAEVHGARLYYEVAGAGHPLILIHAGIANSRMWDDQFGVFAQHYRVIRYDLRGCGKSKAEDGPFSHRQDLRDLLTYVGVTCAFLCGVSAGGSLAIDFTLEHPDMVDTLIVVAPGLSGYAGGHSQTEAEKMLFEESQRAKGEEARLSELAVKLWVDGPGQLSDRVDPQIRNRVRTWSAENFKSQPSSQKSQPLDPPALGRLDQIRVPTLVLLGPLDVSGILAIANLLERGIQGARKVIIPGTAHMLNMEKPEEFNSVVINFLRGR